MQERAASNSEVESEQSESSSLLAGVGTNRIEAFSLISFIPFNLFSINGVQVCLALYVLVPLLYILPGRIDSYWAGRHQQKAS